MRAFRPIRRLSGVLPLLLSATSCLPAFTTLQRATTLSPGRMQVAVVPAALGIQGEPFTPPGQAPDPVDPNAPPKPAVQFVPNVELAVRRGLAPNVDAGMRLWFTGVGMAVDVKWRFVHTDALQLAIAPAVGIDLLSLLAAAQSSNSAGATVAAYLPLIAGLRTGPHELLFGARLVAAMYAFQATGSASTTAVPLVIPGGFIGYDLEVFPALHVVPEVSAYCTPAGTGCLFTGAVAFWFP